MQHSANFHQTPPELFVREMSPHESDWKQPGVPHRCVPTDLTHVAWHISSVAPSLYRRLCHSLCDCCYFRSLVGFCNLKPSALFEAFAVLWASSATVTGDVSLPFCCGLCSTALLRAGCADAWLLLLRRFLMPRRARFHSKSAASND